ncbi:MAG: helix-turn-helix domain-containing protein [Dehalococcoidia bacterium]|nr:helix-turn-helix domain-containing protein [Dehalococcoidia bacterium]
MINEGHMDDMLTVSEVARLLHVHPNTLRRWSNSGRIKAYRINLRGDRRYRLRDIEGFLAQLNSHRDSASGVC